MWPAPCTRMLAVGQQAASCRVLRERDAVVATGGAIPWKSGLIPALASGKERFKRLVQTMQHVLRTLGVYQSQTPIGTHRWQLATLVVEVDRLVASFPRANSLLQGGVIEARGLTELIGQKFHLWFGGVDPVFKSDGHLIPVCSRTPMFNRARRILKLPVQRRPMRSPRYPSAWLKPAAFRARSSGLRMTGQSRCDLIPRVRRCRKHA